ncbi:ferredoxin [Streptomyces albipurpureus]|uniref:Ferredoxin n=1 Tax=Streptomyces albipurpureus TaxID=2897419 RepID=A0ABT0UYZ0_9ACTN|nr:ferredoxin [Streptomyces sp. CWNU-1]MCM2392528.1 ferredoxin [Streptomyces sp. CWNU-1]
MTERIELDRALCIGSGLCAATAPGHFALDADRRSRLREDAGAPDERVEDAAAVCPVEAITINAPAV